MLLGDKVTISKNKQNKDIYKEKLLRKIPIELRMLKLGCIWLCPRIQSFNMLMIQLCMNSNVIIKCNGLMLNVYWNIEVWSDTEEIPIR